MGIFPISEVIFAKKQSSESNLNWLLFDVYKVAENWPLEISIFARILNDHNVLDSQCALSNYKNDKNGLLQITNKFQKKSTRLDLKGLALDCGLVVSVFFFFGKSCQSKLNTCNYFSNGIDSLPRKIYIS